MKFRTCNVKVRNLLGCVQLKKSLSEMIKEDEIIQYPRSGLKLLKHRPSLKVLLARQAETQNGLILYRLTQVLWKQAWSSTY